MTTLKRLAVVRHGETDWNARQLFQGRVDRPLNDTGHAQAAAIAEHLDAWTWDRVVSSPLVRAHDTARAVQQRLALPETTLVPGLVEQAFGEAEGMHREAVFAAWPDRNFPGGETREQVHVRVGEALNDIVSDGSATILVAHFVIVQAVTELLTGTRPASVANASATVLTYDGSRWLVETVVEPVLPAQLHGSSLPARLG